MTTYTTDDIITLNTGENVTLSIMDYPTATVVDVVNLDNGHIVYSTTSADNVQLWLNANAL